MWAYHRESRLQRTSVHAHTNHASAITSAYSKPHTVANSVADTIADTIANTGSFACANTSAECSTLCSQFLEQLESQWHTHLQRAVWSWSAHTKAQCHRVAHRQCSPLSDIE